MSGIRTRLPRRVAALLVVGLVAAALFGAQGTATAKAAAKPKCVSRVLVLSASPAEIGPLLAAARVDRSRTVEVDGRQFWVGKLAGNDVVLALTGIGPAN